MERKRNIPTNWIARIAVVLLLLVLLSAHLSGGMLARYRVSSSGGDSARVAVFKVTGTGVQAMEDFYISMNPDDQGKMCAVMEVYNESEVSVRCTVEVESTGNLPLEFYIQNNGATVEYVDIPVGSEDPADINLLAGWKSTEDSYLYHREMDHITVKLVCEQID